MAMEVTLGVVTQLPPSLLWQVLVEHLESSASETWLLG